jgi:hypothetical protein
LRGDYTNDVISTVIKHNRKIVKPFILQTSSKILDAELGERLPLPDIESVKVISLSGGVVSASFIKYVADKEPIAELTASTLRIGEKQFRYLYSLFRSGKIQKCRFFTSNLQKKVDSKNKKYNYYRDFLNVCEKCGWKNITVNNHSKIILMKTEQNHYVLETSSNLNENPKIEQYSFENSRELYDFYYGFFNKLEGCAAK